MSTANPKAMSGTGVLYSDRRDFYIRPNVVKELWTDVTPFTTIVANRQTVTGLADPVFKLFEHRDPWIKQEAVSSLAATVNSGSTSAETTLSSIVGLSSTVDSSYAGLIFEVWDTTRTTKKGQVYTYGCPGGDSNTSAGTITMKNITGSAITFVNGDVLVCIGNAQAEGSYSPEAWSDELKVVWGSTQIFETPIEITGTLYKAALRGYSNELARLRLQKSKEHKMQKERAFLFGSSLLGTNLDGNGTFGDTAGTQHVTAPSGGIVRTTMGIVTAIERYGTSTATSDDQNIFTINEASYKYSNFVDDMEKIFRYYPDGGVKYALCGPGALSYWSKLDGSAFLAGKSGWQVKIGESQRDALGFNVRMMETPHGVLALVPTPALRGPYNKYMVVLSDDNLLHVQYDAPKFMANIKTENGYKGEKDVYVSDEGVGMTLIESHKLLKIV